MLHANKVEPYMRQALLLGVLIVLAVVPQFARANDLIPYSYDERTHRSDVVIIGETLSPSGSESSTCCDNFAAIKVIRVLKGRASHVVNVFTQNEVIDLDPRCCKIGKTYLFFLSMRARKPYAIVDGRFGAIPLD